MVSLTTDAGLTAADEIDGLDLAIDRPGAAHAVWRETTDVYSGSQRVERIVYRRGSGTPLRWGPRVVLAGSQDGVPRVVAGADGIHVLAGSRLHHWLLPLAGGEARDLGTLLDAQTPAAAEFDAAAMGDGLLVVYADTGAPSRRQIHARRWTPAGVQPSIPLPRAARASPVLLAAEPTVQAFWANNTLAAQKDPASGVIGYRSASRVETSRSDDGGASWTAPVALPIHPNGDVAAVAVSGTPAAPALFVAANGLFELHGDGKAWTAPMRIAQYEPGTFAGSAQTSAVAATQCDGHVAIAWVDARNRGSDRHWWNLLGGFPWGDNPDWINNDLFVATRLPRDSRAAGALIPTRLTAAGSMTRDVAIGARGNSLLVLHVGRAKVRKSPDDAGAPPEVLQSVVPCD